MSTTASSWRVTEQGIEAIPIHTPKQWGPDAFDFESLELARFAKHLHRPTKPRAQHQHLQVSACKSPTPAP